MVHHEDEIAQEPAQEPAAKRGNILLTLILFILVLSIAGFTYLKGRNIDLRDISLKQILSINNTEQRLLNENIFEIPYDSKEHPVFSEYKEYIVKCNKDGIWFLDKKGREVWSIGTPFGKPVIKSNGTYLLVADMGGKDIYVLEGKSIFWNDKTEENILNADINEGGYVTLITASEHYNGEVRVYDNHGIELFRRIIANEFALAAKIDPYQEQMVIELVNPSGIKSNTIFKYYDMYGLNKEELDKKELTADKGLFPLIWFTGNGSLFAAGDSLIMLLDKNRNIKWEKSFDIISSACITGVKRLAAVVKDKGVNYLKVFSENGHEYSSTALSNEVLNIESYGGIIALNSIREVNLYSERGRHIGKYVSKTDIEYVMFFSRNQIAIVTKNSIVMVET